MVNTRKLNCSIGDRRPAAIKAIYTDTSKLESKLGWKEKKSPNIDDRQLGVGEGLID